MQSDAVILRGARSVRSLAPLVFDLMEFEPGASVLREACARGYFRPAEDERLRLRFSRYLTARAALLETIEELRPIVFDDGSRADADEQLRAFVIAYAAACLLVCAGQAMVEVASAQRLLRRKLDEAAPRFGIEAGQFSRLYKSVTSPANAWRLREAMRMAEANRERIDALADDSAFGEVVDHLRRAEGGLRSSRRGFLKMRFRYRLHSLRRRQMSAIRHAMFGLFEASGRVVAEMRNPFHSKRVDQSVLGQFQAMLEPGDVIVTRHDDAMSNLFLPGFWPHAALHVGSASQREGMDLKVDDDQARRWRDEVRVLEARKDGVRFRPLADTLAVDSVAVIRPMLDGASIARAISRAVGHEGKLYDFRFDFRRADRLVCTEVVYRAFDGIGPIQFKLTERGGHPTFSAEDLLDHAVEGRGFEPIAVFGVDRIGGGMVTGPAAAEALAATYRKQSEK